MNAKWYISAFIVAITFFGINQEQLNTPNQEIVLQFSNVEVSSFETKQVISNVKEQLKTIGVLKVGVKKEANGRLIISYYSNTHVVNVKALLSNNTSLLLDYTDKDSSNLPEQPSQKTYNLDVFEIQEENPINGFGSDGTFVFQSKQDYDRSPNPNFYSYLKNLDTKEKNKAVAVAYKFNRTLAIAINNIHHKIPEGRAGPVS